MKDSDTFPFGVDHVHCSQQLADSYTIYPSLCSASWSWIVNEIMDVNTWAKRKPRVVHESKKISSASLDSYLSTQNSLIYIGCIGFLNFWENISDCQSFNHLRTVTGSRIF